MVKLVWLSDLHFTCAENRVLEHDPTVRLTAAIDDINAHHGDALACIISGDLVDRGGVAEYRELKTHLDKLAIRWVPMVGNHDVRDVLRTELVPEGLADGHSFIQYSLPTDAGLVLCLDTLKAGSDQGEYCADRYAWLGEALTAAGDVPTYVFMHHPPGRLGLPMQDQDCLEKFEEFLSFLHAKGSVRHLFVGHVHRPISGSLSGIPFTSMRSCLYQAPSPWPSWNWSTFAPAAEAPNYGVIELTDENVLVHYHQFCPFELGTESA